MKCLVLISNFGISIFSKSDCAIIVKHGLEKFSENSCYFVKSRSKFVQLKFVGVC